MQYLLGKLSDSEAALLEEKYFADDSVFDNIEIAEDELIDAYVRNRLSAEDRKQFETKLLGSERIAERVEFARLLSKSGFSRPVNDESSKVSWWRGLFDFSLTPNPAMSGAVAGVAFLIVLGIPGSLVWMQLRNESTRLALERAAIEQQKQQLAQEIADRQSKTNQLATDLQSAKEQQERLQQQLQAMSEQLATTSRQSTISTIASTLLFPYSTRSPGQANELIVRPSASTIELKLALEADEYKVYQATIKSAGNPNVFTRQRLRSRRSGQDRMIILQFPSGSVSSGEYSISVSGLTPSGTYDPVADYRVRLSKK
jgi:hypothetical protein